MISDASLIANYDVKRCYEVEITFYYQIQGGLTSSTINNTRKAFSDLLSRMSSILSSLPECSNVTVTRKDIINSPPGVRSVFFRIPLIFTASTSVPDYEVSKELTVCISTLSAYKQFFRLKYSKNKARKYKLLQLQFILNIKQDIMLLWGYTAALLCCGLNTD